MVGGDVRFFAVLVANARVRVVVAANEKETYLAHEGTCNTCQGKEMKHEAILNLKIATEAKWCLGNHQKSTPLKPSKVNTPTPALLHNCCERGSQVYSLVPGGRSVRSRSRSV